jgi:hypothetical protein
MMKKKEKEKEKEKERRRDLHNELVFSSIY